MNTYDIIDRLPFDIADRLASDPYFYDIPVVVSEKGSVKAELQRRAALAEEKSGKRGAGVVVLQLVADDLNPGLQLGPMKFMPSIQVFENVEMNNDDAGTGKSHRQIARRIRDVLKTVGFVGLVVDFRPASPCIVPTDFSDLGDLVKGSTVHFECIETSGESITVVQPPIFAADANGHLTISCATVGAQIWFTLDDSYPYPGDADAFEGSTAKLYSGPVTMTQAETIVRACAYLVDETDSVASWINRQTIISQLS